MNVPDFGRKKEKKKKPTFWVVWDQQSITTIGTRIHSFLGLNWLQNQHRWRGPINGIAIPVTPPRCNTHMCIPVFRVISIGFGSDIIHVYVVAKQIVLETLRAPRITDLKCDLKGDVHSPKFSSALGLPSTFVRLSCQRIQVRIWCILAFYFGELRERFRLRNEEYMFFLFLILFFSPSMVTLLKKKKEKINILLKKDNDNIVLVNF